jgi:hypothetical protein
VAAHSKNKKQKNEQPMAQQREPHKREYLEFFESENCLSRLDDMIKAGKTRLIANVNELRTMQPERARMWVCVCVCASWRVVARYLPAFSLSAGFWSSLWTKSTVSW